MRFKNIFAISQEENSFLGLRQRLVRKATTTLLTLAIMLTSIGGEDLDLNPMVKSAEAGRHNLSQSMNAKQQEQWLIILYWANKFGYIDLKEKVLVVPKSERKTGSPYTTITKYMITPQGITVPPEGRKAGSPNTVITQYQMKDGVLTVPPEARKVGSPHTTITKYIFSPQGITVPPEGRKAGSPNTVITQYQMKDGVLTAPPEARKAGSPHTTITKILIVPIDEFNKNPEKYTDS